MTFKFQQFYIDANHYTGLIENIEQIPELLESYNLEEVLNLKKRENSTSEIPIFEFNSSNSISLIEFLTIKE